MKLSIALRNAAFLLTLAFALTALSGCSLFKKSPEGETEDQAPVADAATDAIPTAPAEGDELAQAPDAPPEVPAPDAPAPAPEAPLAPAEPVAQVAEPAPPVEEPKVSSGSADTKDYTIQSGETLMQIAFETYGDMYKWRDIYEANRAAISDPSALVAGTVIRLEVAASSPAIDRNGEKYLIKRGDTLGTISGDVYGTRTKWRKLWENNRQLIKDPNLIFAGFYLYYLPEAGGAPQQELAPQPLANSASGAEAEQRVPAASDAPVDVPAPDFPAAQ